MKRTNKYDVFILCLLVFMVCSSIPSAYAQSYIPATVDASGATLEWNEDGSVKVIGTARFTSPIKKYNDDLVSVSSDEMILVDVSTYLTEVIGNIDVDALGNLSVLSWGNLAQQREDYLNDTRYFIEMKKNETGTNLGSAELKVYRRWLMENIDDLQNTESNKFGFSGINTSDNTWVIYGTQTKPNTNINSFYKSSLQLNSFDGLPTGFSSTTNYQNSKDYVRLFNKRHGDNKAWWKNRTKNIIRGSLNVLMDLIIVIATEGQFWDIKITEYADLTSELSLSKKFEDGIFSFEEVEKLRQVTNNRGFIKNISISPKYNNLFAKEMSKNAFLATLQLANMTIDNKKLDGTYHLEGIGEFDESTLSFINLPEFTDYTEELIAPEREQQLHFFQTHKSSREGEWCKLPQHIHQQSIGDHLSLKCTAVNREPVVATLEVSDATVREVSFPGLSRPLTPYQMFRNLKFTPSSNVDVEVISAIDPEIKAAEEHFSGTLLQELPKHFYYPIGPSVDYQLNFETADLGFYEFYLISELDVNGIVTTLDNSNPTITSFVKYVDELGNFATDGTKLYKLYKVGTSEEVVNLNLGTKTFLAGDTTKLLNHKEATEDVVVNNGLDQAIFINESSVQLNDAQLTINGDVLLYDVEDKDNMEALIGTEKFQLYVGSQEIPNAPLDEFGNPSRAVGIVTENYVINDREQFLLPDFVFDEVYKRRSLEDYEQFVNENKHLPHVPSQKEVDQQNYYSIPEMMMGQLQNLEEIVLHAIDQEEKLNAQKELQASLRERLQKLEQKITEIEKNSTHED